MIDIGDFSSQTPIPVPHPVRRKVGFVLFAIAIVLGLLGTIFAALAEARSRREEPPYVSTDRPSWNRCDNAAPCPGRLVLIKNPQYRRISVVVWCLSDPRTAVSAEISGRGKATFDIGTDRAGGLQEGDCNIMRWTRR